MFSVLLLILETLQEMVNILTCTNRRVSWKCAWCTGIAKKK